MATNDEAVENSHDIAQTPTTIDWAEQVADALREQADDESHVEKDPSVFHPSQIGYPKWLVFVKKLGLDQFDVDTLGAFKTGELIHEWFEDHLDVDTDNVVFEREIEWTTPEGITFVGQFDAYDYVNDVVYDFKSRASWYNFDPPVDRHLDQLNIYMEAVDALYGQVVYVSKKDMEIKTWPEDGAVLKDDERVGELVDKAADVRRAYAELGGDVSAITHEDDIPFERGDSYFEESTDLIEDIEAAEDDE